MDSFMSICNVVGIGLAIIGIILSSSVVNAAANNEDCISLQHRFQEPLWELPNNTESLGEPNKTHYSNVFSGQPLMIGSINGTKIAESFGECNLLPDLKDYYCVGEFVFDDNTRETMSWAGILPNNDLEPGIFAITGGTGCYDRAKGALRKTPQRIDDEDQGVAFLWEFVEPLADMSTCTPLSSRFENGSLLYAAGPSKAEALANEAAGDRSLWSASPITTGNIDGILVADSYGACMLLPENEAYQCDGVIKFGDTNDTLTFSGILPNSYETGKMMITGGTGCYIGSGGSLWLTAIKTEEPIDYFQLVYLIDVSNNDTCKSLAEIFNDQPLFEYSTSDIFINASDAGGLDVYFNNSVRVGDMESEIVAYDSGFCTTLATGGFAQCSGVLVFDYYGSISYQGLGLAPNSNNTGYIPITGGDGCFDSVVGGTLHLIEIVGNDAAFKWELLSSIERKSNSTAPEMEGNGGVNETSQNTSEQDVVGSGGDASFYIGLYKTVVFLIFTVLYFVL